MSGKGPSDSGRCAAGVSVADASEAIGLSKITVLRRLRAGAWPGGRSGRKWLVSSEFVRAVEHGLGSPQFDIEDFAATWMARNASPAEVVALCPALPTRRTPRVVRPRAFRGSLPIRSKTGDKPVNRTLADLPVIPPVTTREQAWPWIVAAEKACAAASERARQT